MHALRRRVALALRQLSLRTPPAPPAAAACDAAAAAAHARAQSWREASTSAAPPPLAAAAAGRGWTPAPEAVAASETVTYVGADGEALLLELTSRRPHGFRGVTLLRDGRFAPHRGAAADAHATPLEAALARARRCKAHARGAYAPRRLAAAAPLPAGTPPLPPWPPEQRAAMDAFWRERGLPAASIRVMLARAEHATLFRNRETLQTRLDGLRALFPATPPALLVARSVNVLLREPASVAAKLAALAAGAPEADWVAALAHAPMLVCHTPEKLLRNWRNAVDVLGLPCAMTLLRRSPGLLSRPAPLVRSAAARLAQLLPGRDVAAIIAAQPTMLSCDLGPASLLPVKLARLAEAGGASAAWGAELAAWRERDLARALTCGQRVLDRLRYLASSGAAATSAPTMLTVLKLTQPAFAAAHPGFDRWAAARADEAAARLLRAGEGDALPALPRRMIGTLSASAATDWLTDFGPGGRLRVLRRAAAAGAAAAAEEEAGGAAQDTLAALL